MAACKAPAEPLLVVLGSTGTGKSELAVELATRFKGEIINADAMQLYDGLPVMTNKMPRPEQRGIPHHLLGHVSLDDDPWDVEDFERAAAKVMREIRSRGNLPILVGGTHYYVDPLLFPDVILHDVHSNSTRPLPVLQEPTDVLLQELRQCDPIMADRWHPNDRRKIQRSLEIFLHTGKPASQFYAEQRERKAAAAKLESPGRSWDKLLFWVYSDRDVLCERLDKRVDQMLDAGLLDEVRQLFRLRRERTARGQVLDLTKGIWQSIGYKQFEPYLTALDDGEDATQLERLRTTALEDMKAATRRYASYQTRWIKLKQFRRLQEQGPEAVASLYLVDSTDASRFQDRVVAPAAELTGQFLRGEPRRPAAELSERAREILGSAGDPPPRETPRRRTCELCQAVLLTEQAWQRHIKGAAHKKTAKRKQRLALVPCEAHDPDGPDGRSAPSSPEIASLF